MAMENMFGYTETRWSTPSVPARTRRRNAVPDPSLVNALKKAADAAATTAVVSKPPERLSSDYTTRIRQIVDAMELEPAEVPPGWRSTRPAASQRTASRGSGRRT